ncbi:MAG: hypothetical protein Ct9H300mP28_08950 [Pseudomonadota bacterium]|nr:MAG: hypothetical protein Ct9H300mP28_08950 [Pseudomonadota bacterium]
MEDGKINGKKHYISNGFDAGPFCGIRKHQNPDLACLRGLPVSLYPGIIPVWKLFDAMKPLVAVFE